MEAYIKHITLINECLNNDLSESEKSDFENKLLSDSDFKEAYDAHLIFLGGMERIRLKNEIVTARKGYLRAKWIKGIFIAGLAIVLGIVAFLFSQKEEAVISPHVQEEESVQVEDTIKVEEEKLETLYTEVDSTANENEIISVEKPTVVEEVSKEKEVVYETDNVTEKVDVFLEKQVVTTTEKPDFDPIRKSPETFVVDNEKGMSITCKEGTKLSFQKHAFINKKTGKLVRGKINLKVEEYYKMNDIVLADLTTTSNGDMLETGGMLHIAAEKNGQELALDPMKSMRVEFPIKEKKEAMQLFLGEENEDGINWVIKEVEKEEELEDVDVPLALVEEVPVFPSCEDVVRAQQRACFNSKIRSFIVNNLNTKLAESMGIADRQRVYLNFVIDTTGSIQRIRSRGDYTILNQEAERVISLLPKINPGVQRGRKVNVPFSIPIDFNLNSSNVISGPDRLFRRRKSDSVSRSKFQASIESKDPSRLSNPEINAYIFSGTKLGWINCDRFRRTNQKMMVKIKDAEGSKIKLIFKNIRSVLPGNVLSNAVDFGSVPSNTPALLFALKKIDGKFYMATKEITTAKGLELDLDFKEMSLKQLRQAVEKAVATK
ncbi:energy transducer TonB [Spongiivirga sp. MCCC 1A20706]|uniref:energy transducer TonB n=1 Tax=Spongiivirga sp. MCCC 1A20706 TaxID=3160963 RepID=UPI0039778E5A